MQDGNRNRNYGQQSYGRQQNPVENPRTFFNNLVFDPNWIKTGANEKMVEYSERVGRYLADNGLTNSKIRNIYGEIKRIQMGKFSSESSSFYLLKPKVAYAYGREKNNKGLELFKLVFDQSIALVESDGSNFKHFSNFLEAILAYHKSYGGKD